MPELSPVAEIVVQVLTTLVVAALGGTGAYWLQRILARHAESTRVAGAILEQRVDVYRRALHLAMNYLLALEAFISAREEGDPNPPPADEYHTGRLALQNLLVEYRLIMHLDVWRALTKVALDDVHALDRAVRPQDHPNVRAYARALRAAWNEQRLFEIEPIEALMIERLNLRTLGRTADTLAEPGLVERLRAFVPGRRGLPELDE